MKMENIRNQDGIGEKELLVVSFGTSFPESRRKTIGAIEDALERQFGDYSLRRAFTSGIILRSVARKEGLNMDSISAALERARKNGVKELLVQPTTMMNGFEYDKLVSLVREHSAAFASVKIGAPLLSSEEDFDKLIDAVTDAVQEYDDGKTAVIFMGHGTEAASNGVYCRLQSRLLERGFSRYYVGTVEAEPTVRDVLKQIPPECRRVVLEPLMIVAGDHANHDMAGDEEDSWKSIFSAAGYEVVCLLRGLGEQEAVHAIFADHARDAIALECMK